MTNVKREQLTNVKREQSTRSHQRTPTLGPTLRQTRQPQHRALAEVAAHVSKPDGMPLSPQYRSDIAQDHSRPSPHVLAALARTRGLDADVLLVRAKCAESVVRQYLSVHPEQEKAVIACVCIVQTLHCEAWERRRHMLRRGEMSAIAAAERSNVWALCPAPEQSTCRAQHGKANRERQQS